MFAGRHFDREVILLCVRCYLRYKLSLRDLVEMIAERGLELCSHDHHALGPTVCPGVRKELGSLCTQSWPPPWRIDEMYLKVRGRWLYLYRAVDKGGQYSRLPAESKKRRCGGQGVLPQGAPHPRACSHQHHAGWLCRVASSSARDVERKRGTEAHQDASLEIPKQSSRAGSSRDQVQNRPHARIQATMSYSKANLPSAPYASKIKLCPLSGMLCLSA
jgi:DDE domain